MKEDGELKVLPSEDIVEYARQKGIEGADSLEGLVKGNLYETDGLVYVDVGHVLGKRGLMVM